MKQKGFRTSPVIVTDHSNEQEDKMRSSQNVMVPEVRALERKRVSNLKPEGLPPPGKTTQGFRPSTDRRLSSRSSSAPKSFRTVRNFWRRLEGAEADTRPPSPRGIKPVRPWGKQATPAEQKKMSISQKAPKKISAKKDVLNIPAKQSLKDSSVKKPFINEPVARKSLEKKRVSQRGSLSIKSLEPAPDPRKIDQSELSKKILPKFKAFPETSIESVLEPQRKQSVQPTRDSMKEHMPDFQKKKSLHITEESKKGSIIDTKKRKSVQPTKDKMRESAQNIQIRKSSQINKKPKTEHVLEPHGIKPSQPTTEPSRELVKESGRKKSLEPTRKSIKKPMLEIQTTSPEPSTESMREFKQDWFLKKEIEAEHRKSYSDPLQQLKSSSGPRKSLVTEQHLRKPSYQEEGYESEDSITRQSPATSAESSDEEELRPTGRGSARHSRRKSITGPKKLSMIEESPSEDETAKEEAAKQAFEEEEEELQEEEEEIAAFKQKSKVAHTPVKPRFDSLRTHRGGSKVGAGRDSTPTGPAVLRPASLWAELPRMFSDESLHRPSVILPVLLEEEKLFHELVAGDDVNSVDDFLKKRPKFNLNCANYQGISALHIAVKNDNEDMVQYLLSLPSIEVGDTHLFAIRDNHPGILRMILDKLQSINPSLEFMSCSNSPEFAENVTPLILAAEAGHYEIIGLLLSRGHTIPRPHKPRCFCQQECQAILKTQDHLSVSSGKLHIYRALSNPAYMCQTNSDPLLTAFKLSQELLTCGHVDTIYLRQYEALAESLRQFAVDLIAECRTLEEVEVVLSEHKDCDLKGAWTYPRLILAMDFKQKEFVAHPNVQQVLERTWMGEWLAWRGYRVYRKALHIFPRLVSLPAVLAILMFTPTSRWAKYYSLPVNKLLSDVASYLVFLCLVFFQSDVNKKDQTRDTKPTGVEIFLVIYVIAFMYNSLRSLFRQGFIRYFKFMWNIYELVMELFFLLAFIFLITAEIKTTLRGDKSLERKYWNYWDPELVSESFFVLATVMAFMRILLIFQISYHLGPLQVSLGKMTNDCAMFSVIFGIIIIAFTAGLCKFYAYYEDMAQTNPETGEVESTQVNSFTSILDTFKTLFWGLFSMSSYDVADVVVENIKDENNNSTVLNEHHLTEAVGYFAFAVYMILTVIVILNMLIATMSNTFQKVTDNVDTEWVFGRTEVYMSYIDAPVLPPPFNIIPTTHGIVSLFKGSKEKAGQVITKDVEKGNLVQEKNIEEYYMLMSQLVQRYFSTKNTENE